MFVLINLIADNTVSGYEYLCKDMFIRIKYITIS